MEPNQYGKQRQNDAVQQRHGLAEGKGLLQRRRCLALCQQAQGIGHSLQLQGQQRHHRQQHAQRCHGADRLAVIAKHQQIRQRENLEAPRQFRQWPQHQRCEQKHRAGAEIVGQGAVTVLKGQFDYPVERPGTGEDTQRQDVSERVPDYGVRYPAALGAVGDAEQQ